MDFDPDMYLRRAQAGDGGGAFDPDAYLAKLSGPAAKPKDDSSFAGAGEAALEHFGNSASLGYLPQLQAVASQVTPDPNADVDAKLRAQGFKIEQPKETYVGARDANIKRMEQEGKDYPWASAAGSVGGALASGAALSAVAPINAVTRLGRIAQAGRAGLILGAASNPGDREGVVAGDAQLGGRLTNGLIGGALGAGGQGAMEGLSAAARGAQNIPAALQGKAEERAFKSSGAMLKDYRQIAGQDRINELGRYMLDNGLVKPDMAPADIAKAAEALQSQHGEAIGNILQSLDEGGHAAPSAKDLADAVRAHSAQFENMKTAQPTYKALQDVAADMETMGKPAADGSLAAGTIDQLTGKGEEILLGKDGSPIAKFMNGKMQGEAPTSGSVTQGATIPSNPNAAVTDQPGSFRTAQDIKNFVADQVNASGGFKGLNPSEKNLALRKVYGIVSDKLEEGAQKAAEDTGDHALLQNYLKSKAGYRNARDISDIASDQALRQNANRFFSPTDYLSGVGGAAMGFASGDNMEDRLKHAAVGAGLGVANKIGRTYGTPAVSLGLDKLGAGLSRLPLSAITGMAAPVIGAAVRSPVAPAAAEALLTQPSLEQAALRSVASGPAKGEDKWAQAGLSNLGIKDPAQAQQLLSSPQAKRLLIQASDYSPGSKAYKNAMKQIQQHLTGAP